MKKLPLPKSQMQEVLYELISRLYIDRRTMMLSSGVWNLTARISDLRNKGLKIISTKIESTNKYGREITFCTYSINNKKEAAKMYVQMTSSRPLI